jgi:hypothetical protein
MGMTAAMAGVPASAQGIEYPPASFEACATEVIKDNTMFTVNHDYDYEARLTRDTAKISFNLTTHQVGLIATLNEGLCSGVEAVTVSPALSVGGMVIPIEKQKNQIVFSNDAFTGQNKAPESASTATFSYMRACKIARALSIRGKMPQVSLGLQEKRTYTESGNQRVSRSTYEDLVRVPCKPAQNGKKRVELGNGMTASPTFFEATEE